MAQFFTGAPKFGMGKMHAVKDVIGEMLQFNAEYELGANGSVNNCSNIDKSMWRKLVADSSINAGSKAVELDFMEKIAGGRTELIPAKKMTFRQASDFDRNIRAKSAAVASGPGASVWFTLAKSFHTVKGVESYVAVGWELWNHADKQWMRIMDVNRDVPYAHQVRVTPLKAAYQINIRQDAKLLVKPATQVGGYACNNDFVGVHKTLGYFYDVTMKRSRVQWKQAVDLMKGYEEVLQFGILFDSKGKQIDCWEWYKKLTAMEDLKFAQNLDLFTGQKVDNPDIFTESLGGDTSYPGYDGYMQQVANAGGIQFNFDPEIGILPEDWEAFLLKRDAGKRVKEFIIWRSMAFQMMFDRNFSNVLKNHNGDCMFETFRRTDVGNDKQAITRLGVESIRMWGLTLHFKDFDALTDERALGNGDFPLWGFIMPSAGLVNDKGESVPPIQTFVNKGCALTGEYEEHEYDARKERNGCDEIGGYMTKTIGMAVHGLQDHGILKPRTAC